ncbi:NAD(P)/FAD-dependent oxidoreductase [Agromyces sp. Marseille-P2726]|uniref:NAD(P)/FAD-dependent oxidoreductase n=1 Tax=Agromyces sp. Marseille-P2726 TaxID=2709132 RepID=UPI00156F7049|nr:NAD(P)/FAD-dependent oxidoreductase [Agromyces sp. Marseille-P2726]
MHNTSWDVIIIGGGSAGLSAALQLGRSRRRVLVLDSGAPRNRFAAHMHGVLGRDGWSPLDLLAAGRDEVARYGVVVEVADVTSASFGDDGFQIVVDGTHHIGRRLLVATGVRDELPDVPGLAEQWGTGAAVCPYCDGWEVRDQRIAVLASGEMSVHQAQLLRQLSTDITYFVNGSDLSDEARAGLVARGVDVEPRRVDRVLADEDGRLSGIRLVDGAEVPIDAIFLHPRPVPNDGVLRSLGATTTELAGVDWVAVDENGRTSVAGLFAAGNVVSPRTSVPMASGSGNAVGAMINADLVEEDVRLAAAASGASLA